MTGDAADRTAWELAAAVPDPELPVVTIAELGILREVVVDGPGRVRVAITPTYSGCPAMETIRADLVERLSDAGFTEVVVEQRLSPAWTTDDITEQGRAALAAAGIAPPATARAVDLELTVPCPQCGSPHTREVSRFGATACTGLWVCRDCHEPFEHVRVLA